MSKKKVHHPYEELKRWLTAFTLFCASVAVIGMGFTGSRVTTIACWGAIVIVSLNAITRIIIWGLSSWESVKRGAQDTKKPS